MHNVELAAGRGLFRVGAVSLSGCGQSSLLVKVQGLSVLILDFCRNGVTRASRSEHVSAVRIVSGVRVTGLDHEIADHAVEGDAVIVLYGSQADEVLLVLWSVFI